MNSAYRALLRKSRDRRGLGLTPKIWINQRKSEGDRKLMNVCRVLFKEKYIERWAFDDVSAKCKVRIEGKWIVADEEKLLQIAERNGVLAKAKGAMLE